MQPIIQKNNQQGAMLIIVLVFSSVFTLVLGALVTLIQVQRIRSIKETSSTQAIAIAEAGVNYYRWHLAHDPDEFVQDTGIRDYTDPFGSVIGQYNLQVTPPEVGSTIVKIRATGWTTDNPNIQRTVEAQYGTQSLAQYAFLSNSNVWFGETEQLKGPMHSNGGIRMDGQSNSTVTSAKETYICGPEHGCNNEEKPGIWGTGTNANFWEFPVPGIDFQGIAVDIAAMEIAANEDGLFLPDSNNYGYLIQFSQTGKMSVFYVTGLYAPVQGYNGTQWVNEANDYRTTSAVAGLQDVALPNNGLIYVEENKVWVEGTLKGNATVVAAVPQEQGSNATILIQNDLKYKDQNSARLGLIAQKDILIPLRSPDFMKLDGALLAQNGHVFRYYYPPYNSQPYKTYALRNKIQTYGTIITNTLWTWSWVNDPEGPVVSGYQQTQTFYDSDLLYTPPPFFPTSGGYAFISWNELLPGQ